MLNKFKIFAYKKKRRLYNFYNRHLQEIFFENNLNNLYYGHYDILKKYSKILLPYKVNGEIQHGWSPLSGIAGEGLHDPSYKDNRFYVFNERNQQESKDLGYYNVIPIGAPYIYLPNLTEGLENYSKNSIIFFPSHSHEWASFEKPIEIFQNYIRSIKKISSHFKNICVSLGWNEFQNNELRGLFDKELIETITMGPRDGNPNFLFNFVTIAKKFEYVSSDIFSSAIFYSLLINRKAFVYGESLSNQMRYVFGFEDPNERQIKNYSKIYPEIIWENFEDKRYPEIAAKELGLGNKRSPYEIRELFGWNLTGKLNS